MGIKKRLTEAVFGSPKELPKVKPSRAAVLGAVEQNYGIYQVPTFYNMVTTYWDDPLLKEAITMFAEQVVATGIFLTYNGDYKKELDGKTAIKIIEEWCKANKIDLKLIDIAIELKAFGNSVWRINSDFGFVNIPIQSVWHAVRIDPMIPLQEKYHIQLTPIYGGEVIKNGEFIHFRTGITGYHAPFGQGVLYGLLARPVDSNGNVAPSIYDIRLNMRTSLDEGFSKFSFCNELWTFKGMSNEEFDAVDPITGLNFPDRISNMKSTGNRIATNVEGDIKLAVPARTQSYDMFIKQMNDEFFMALADPSLKLGLEQGFTKATSVTASEVYKFKISTMREVIKHQFEDIFVQILNSLGYEGEEAEVRMNFGPEETAIYNIADIFAAVDRDIILKNEARTLLARYHKWDIEGYIKNGELTNDELQQKIGMTTGVVGTSKQATKAPLSIPLQATQTPEQISKKLDEAKKLSEGQEKYLSVSEKNPQSPTMIVKRRELSDSIAGYNADFSIVYIDPIVEDWQLNPLVGHEVFEYRMLKLSKSYDEAHALATRYEETLCKAEGKDWKLYQKTGLAQLAIIRARSSADPADVVHNGMI